MRAPGRDTRCSPTLAPRTRSPRPPPAHREHVRTACIGVQREGWQWGEGHASQDKKGASVFCSSVWPTEKTHCRLPILFDAHDRHGRWRGTCVCVCYPPHTRWHTPTPTMRASFHPQPPPRRLAAARRTPGPRLPSTPLTPPPPSALFKKMAQFIRPDGRKSGRASARRGAPRVPLKTRWRAVKGTARERVEAVWVWLL